VAVGDVLATRWRFIDDGPHRGDANMGRDLALMDEVREDPANALPALRVYAWDPPCVSLGFHQKTADLDLDRCLALGYDVVRRPTGGRAVLHDREITYSLVVPESVFGRATSVIESYRILSQGLIEGLAHLGIATRLAPGSEHAGQGGSAACFASAARCDLVYGDRKVVGSAQVRRKGAILQHGSIPLVDREEAERVAILGDGAEPITGVTDLTTAAGRAVTYAEAAGALRQGFADAFGLEFVAADFAAEWSERVQRHAERALLCRAL